MMSIFVGNGCTSNVSAQDNIDQNESQVEINLEIDKQDALRFERGPVKPGATQPPKGRVTLTKKQGECLRALLGGAFNTLGMIWKGSYWSAPTVVFSIGGACL